MDRNFFRRIETCFPVLDPDLKKRVIDEALRNGLADNTQAWNMDGDGQYQRIQAQNKQSASSQLSLLDALSARPGTSQA
jgi:polyphosphate kinase